MYHQVLIHNVGHHDLFFILENEEEQLVVVPTNVHMHSINKYVYEHLQSNTQISLFSDSTRGDALKFSHPIPIGTLRNKLVRHKRNEQPLQPSMKFIGIILPIAVSVIDCVINQQDYKNNLDVALLTTGQEGYGNNTEAPGEGVEIKKNIGRSTRYVGKLLNLFLRRLYENVSITHHHDASLNDFTFENRPRFFRKTVLPYINNIRQKVVDHYKPIDKEAWINHFSVQLSINTGTTTTIISTLNSLKHYHPSFIHVEKAKSWPTSPFKATRLPNTAFEQNPSVSFTDIECPIQQFTILAMQNWKREFVTVKKTRESKEHSTFFYRKGNKEVLAVVTIRNNKEDSSTQPYIAIRGVNLEVSLPTGSLCAERNAIGSALANNPVLQREDILCVAVLSLSKTLGATLGPCGACQEWLKKISEVNPDLTVLTFEDTSCNKVYIDYI